MVTGRLCGHIVSYGAQKEVFLYYVVHTAFPFWFFSATSIVPSRLPFLTQAACGRNGFQYIFPFSRSADTESQLMLTLGLT